MIAIGARVSPADDLVDTKDVSGVTSVNGNRMISLAIGLMNSHWFDP